MVKTAARLTSPSSLNNGNNNSNSYNSSGINHSYRILSRRKECLNFILFRHQLLDLRLS